MNKGTVLRYRDLRKYHGIAAIYALKMAKAHREVFHELTCTMEWEPEQESYKSVFGEDPPEGMEYLCGIVKSPDGEVLTSLGFVEDDGWYGTRSYKFTVECELAVEVLERARELAAIRNAPEEVTLA
jgi:hypothetical protein